MTAAPRAGDLLAPPPPGPRTAVLPMPALRHSDGSATWSDPQGAAAAYALDGRIGLWSTGMLSPAQALGLAAGLAALAAHLAGQALDG